MTSVNHFHDRAAALSLRSDCWIGGTYVPAVSGLRFPSINPATGAVLTRLARGDSADIDRAVKAARHAFTDGRWRDQTPAARKGVLLRLAGLIRENSEELALLDSLDMGKPITAALTNDVPGAADVLQWTAEAADKLYGELAPTGGPDLAMIGRVPLGVVGAVVPWNFPLNMAVWKTAPALAAGNSVVLKPAEQSSLSALRLAELASEAGLPPGVLNVVPGYGHEAGQALGLHPDVDCIAFTGSTVVGKMFQVYAGQSNMKQVWLETGGKSPNIIFPDADIDDAAECAADGIFRNQGEVCSAASRLLVHRDVMDAVLGRLVRHARGFMPADPLDPSTRMGALVDRDHADRVEKFITEGKETARLLCGGNRVTIGGSDAFMEPTIFVGPDQHSALVQNEIFGPVLTVQAFDTEAEAVQMANDSIYGLAASVWTHDLRRALRLSRALTAGNVSINAIDPLAPMVPFGGMKQSGIGRDLSLHAFAKYTALKTTWIAGIR